MFGKDFPIVFLDRKPEVIKRDAVLAKNTQGVYKATSLLIQKGHSRIAFLSTHILDITMRERFKGYEAALEESNIPLDMSLVRIGNENPKINIDLMFGQGYTFMKDIFTNTDATAVIMGNNLSAMGGYYYLKQNGVKVPSEMAVIAFDNSIWTSLSSPSVSVVNQSGGEMGRRAAQLLIKRINGDKSPFKEIRIQTKLIQRASC